jgi:hypothetical protein
MKDIKKTPSWPQIAVARAAWEKASPQNKPVAARAYSAAVKQALAERDGVPATAATAAIAARRGKLR